MTRLRSVEVAHSENRLGTAMKSRGITPACKVWGRAGRYAMRAVVLQEYGGPENLRCEDNVPDPQISGNTVLIAAAAASVNPIDWKLRSGLRRKDSPLSFPAILGRDVSGIVWAVGTDVKHFKAGDRVLALSIATYAELVAVDDSDVTHLPDGVALADAAAIPLIALTGDQLVRLAANVQKGQIVLVTRQAG
jgi:NADPH:quinone reductase-like Zn-dependent oxidoreductase